MLGKRFTCTIRIFKSWFCETLSTVPPVNGQRMHANTTHSQTCNSPTKHLVSQGSMNILETRNSWSMIRARPLRQSKMYLRLHWLYWIFEDLGNWFGDRKYMKHMLVGMVCLWLEAFKGFPDILQHDTFSVFPERQIIRFFAPRWGAERNAEAWYICNCKCNALWLCTYFDEMWAALSIRQLCVNFHNLLTPLKNPFFRHHLEIQKIKRNYIRIHVSMCPCI